MFKKLMNKKLLKNQKGLTLIELLAVVVILMIVAAIAVPAIGNIIENSRLNAVKADAINVLNAANLYFTEAEAATTTVTVAELKSAKFLENAGKLEDTGVTASVTKKDGAANELTTSSITYSGKKEVKFTNATLTIINQYPKKGSESGDKDIK